MGNILDIFKRSESEKKAKNRKPRKAKTEDERKLEQDRKDKQWARDKMLEKAKDNPELENQYISKLMGITVTSSSPVEKKKQEIKDKVITQALDKISSDPELSARFVDKQVSEIMGETPETDSGDEGDYSEDPIQGVLRQKRDLDELEGEFGGRRGKESTLKDFGDILIGALNTPLGMVLAEKAKGGGIGTGSQSSSGTVVLMVDGKLVRVTEGQYEQLVKDGRVLPIGQVAPAKQIGTAKQPEAPKAEAPKEALGEKVSGNLVTATKEPVESAVPTASEEEDEQEERTTLLGEDGALYASEVPDSGKIEQVSENVITSNVITPQETLIKSALEKLKGTPQELVDFLYEEIIKGTPYSEMIWEMLLVTNYEFLANMCRPYGEHLLYGEYVKRILSPEGRQYVETVLKLVKQKDIEGQRGFDTSKPLKEEQ